MDSIAFPINSASIISVIERIIYDGGKNNFAIFNLGEYYLQIAAARGDYAIHCEAVSDNYLEEHHKLTDKQKEDLLNLSWNPPSNAEENYHVLHQVDSEKTRLELAELLIRTSRRVYQRHSINQTDIMVNLE